MGLEKATLLLLAFITVVQFSFAQETRYKLSSHILEITFLFRKILIVVSGNLDRTRIIFWRYFFS